LLSGSDKSRTTTSNDEVRRRFNPVVRFSDRCRSKEPALAKLFWTWPATDSEFSISKTCRGQSSMGTRFVPPFWPAILWRRMALYDHFQKANPRFATVPSAAADPARVAAHFRICFAKSERDPGGIGLPVFM